MFFCPRANRSRCSSLSHSFLKSDETKEQPWSNRSCCSLQKSNCERFAPVAHDIRSFHKQIAISLFGKQKTSDLLSKPMREFPTLQVFEPDIFSSNNATEKSAVLHSVCSEINYISICCINQCENFCSLFNSDLNMSQRPLKMSKWLSLVGHFWIVYYFSLYFLNLTLFPSLLPTLFPLPPSPPLIPSTSQSSPYSI